MKTDLRRKLNSLWLGELTATVVFIFVFFQARNLWGAGIVGDYALLGLVVLCIILLEGSAYWWLKLRQFNHPDFSLDVRLVQALYAFNLLLLLVFPAMLLIGILNGSVEDSLPDVAIGSGLYIFAIAEFVHYFLVKIVRSSDDQRARTRRRQVTSRLMRELQRGEARKEKHARST